MQHTMARSSLSDCVPNEWLVAVSSGELCQGEERTLRTSSTKLIESQPKALSGILVGEIGDENF